MKKRVLFFGIFVFALMLFSVAAQESFVTNVPLIEVFVQQGEIFPYDLNVINLGDEDIFFFDVSSQSDFVSLSQNEFLVGKNGEASLRVNLDARDLEEGVHVGYLEMSNSIESQKVPIVFGVESNRPLFDVALEEVQTNPVLGDKLEFNSKIYNLGARNNRATLSYKVFDFEGNVIWADSKVVDVSGQTQIKESILLDEKFKEGDYVLSAVIKQDSVSGVGSLFFSVGSPVQLSPENETNNYAFPIAFFVIIFLIVAIILFNHYWNRRVVESTKNLTRKIGDIKKIKFGDVSRKIRKLERRKDLLESSYDKGYITRKSYMDGRKRLNLLIGKLKKRL